MKKTVLILTAVMILLFCVSCALTRSEALFTCFQAASLLAENADAYSDPAPAVGDILGDLPPDLPLTRIEGCRMILRAFGELPDVQEGVRYYAKYRSCAFTDVPEDGKEAVENLTNAGLYVPEDDAVFGPYELMREDELAVLVDRIHAYLQSSPKDDYYSWVTADILNDPMFLDRSPDISFFSINSDDDEARSEWIINMLNDCLENPDTPEKANIAAYISTFLDTEGRENSMQLLQPLIDSIWEAPDLSALLDVCAYISCETGIELLLTKPYWCDWTDLGFYLEDSGHFVQKIGYELFSTGRSPEDYLPGHYSYDGSMEQKLRLFTYLGFDKEEAEKAVHIYLDGIRREGQILYDSSSLDRDLLYIVPEDGYHELADFPLKTYLEKAQFDYDQVVAFDNLAEISTFLSLLSKPENLPGVKVYLIERLLTLLSVVVPAHLRDLLMGYWDDYFAADPSVYYDITGLIQEVLSLLQTDTFIYYSETPEYKAMHEYLQKLCLNIKSYYRTMLENVTWLDKNTKTAVLEKLDAIGMELLIPQDMTGLFRVQFTSAEDGGTLYGNITKFIKERRQWLSSHYSGDDLKYTWSIESNWVMTYYYSHTLNTFFITMSGILGSYADSGSSDEELLGCLGFPIAHEISHAFDDFGSLYNKYGEMEDLWTAKDREEFNRRCLRLADFMSGYEVYPGISFRDGTQVVSESTADLTAMKCIMSIASQIPDFDYRTFFACYAKPFAVSFTRKGWDNLMKNDPHPAGRSRVNRILSLTDEFYTAYDIRPGDAMYVSVEDRPQVW